jgi:hypothetical protein
MSPGSPSEFGLSTRKGPSGPFLLSIFNQSEGGGFPFTTLDPLKRRLRITPKHSAVFGLRGLFGKLPPTTSHHHRRHAVSDGVAGGNGHGHTTVYARARPSIGSTPIAVTVAANTTKLPPDTDAAPLDVTSMTALVRAVLKPAQTLIPSIKAKRLPPNLCRISSRV